MSARKYWHGCLLLLIASVTSAGEPSAERRVSRIGTRRVRLEYRANPDALPLTRVQLWYTLDQGKSWQLTVDSREPDAPLTFEAPTDGEYGLFVVVSNALGTSADPPGAVTAPQQWVQVDATPPVIQLHGVSPTRGVSGEMALAIRWTAVDTCLDPRPIEISYRRWPDGSWQSVAMSLPNTGRFDWALPKDWRAPIEIRAAVRDCGRHVAFADSGRVETCSADALAPNEVGAPDESGSRGRETADAQQRALALYQQGSVHQLRGEFQLAGARFKDALRLDPGLSPALVELAAAMYAQGQHDEAIAAYQLALRQDARSRTALGGIARAYVAKRDYPAAATFLQRVVREYPNDARGWLTLGDVAIHQGDEVQAREYYQQAATRDAGAADVIAAARLRLTDLSALSQRNRTAGSR